MASPLSSASASPQSSSVASSFSPSAPSSLPSSSLSSSPAPAASPSVSPSGPPSSSSISQPPITSFFSKNSFACLSDEQQPLLNSFSSAQAAAAAPAAAASAGAVDGFRFQRRPRRKAKQPQHQRSPAATASSAPPSLPQHAPASAASASSAPFAPSSQQQEEKKAERIIDRTTRAPLATVLYSLCPAPASTENSTALRLRFPAPASSNGKEEVQEQTQNNGKRRQQPSLRTAIMASLSRSRDTLARQRQAYGAVLTHLAGHQLIGSDAAFRDVFDNPPARMDVFVGDPAPALVGSDVMEEDRSSSSISSRSLASSSPSFSSVSSLLSAASRGGQRSRTVLAGIHAFQQASKNTVDVDLFFSSIDQRSAAERLLRAAASKLGGAIEMQLLPTSLPSFSASFLMPELRAHAHTAAAVEAEVRAALQQVFVLDQQGNRQFLPPSAILAVTNADALCMTRTPGERVVQVQIAAGNEHFLLSDQFAGRRPAVYARPAQLCKLCGHALTNAASRKCKRCIQTVPAGMQSDLRHCFHCNKQVPMAHLQEGAAQCPRRQQGGARCLRCQGAHFSLVCHLLRNQYLPITATTLLRGSQFRRPSSLPAPPQQAVSPQQHMPVPHSSALPTWAQRVAQGSIMQQQQQQQQQQEQQRAPQRAQQQSQRPQQQQRHYDRQQQDEQDEDNFFYDEVEEGEIPQAASQQPAQGAIATDLEARMAAVEQQVRSVQEFIMQQQKSLEKRMEQGMNKLLSMISTLSSEMRTLASSVKTGDDRPQKTARTTTSETPSSAAAASIARQLQAGVRVRRRATTLPDRQQTLPFSSSSSSSSDSSAGTSWMSGCGLSDDESSDPAGASSNSLPAQSSAAAPGNRQ